MIRLADLAPEIRAGLACPSWCCLPPDHGEDPEVQRYVHGIPRVHAAAVVLAVASPSIGAGPVTVHVEQYSEWSIDEGLMSEAPTVRVEGMPVAPEGLTADEALAVGRALAEAALPLSTLAVLS